MKSTAYASDVKVTQEELDLYRSRGYNDDVLPKTRGEMKALNYFTLWMGSVHNIPNYMAVAGFLALGLTPLEVMVAIMVSSVALSVFMTMNGLAGSTYGIPFAMHLRSAYGRLGSKLPGFLRGCVAAIAWFGVQNYIGSKALLTLIDRIWPGFASIGGGFNFLGLSLAAFICFILFFILNVLIGIGGGGVLNKFTAILNPLIYIVFGGMAIWALKIGGGFTAIINYDVPTSGTTWPVAVAFLIVINLVMGTWAAPGASAADFTQNARSTRDQIVGQVASFLVAYLIFAFSSVLIIVGAMKGLGLTGNGDFIRDIIGRWDSLPAVALAIIVLLMTTISTNATGNIIPAGYQLSALFPKSIDYKKGVLLASLISFVIMPWKWADDAGGIVVFLGAIGAILGPVAGVMLADFFIIKKRKIDLDLLYIDDENPLPNNPYDGVNVSGYIATAAGFVVALLPNFIHTSSMELLAKLSWIISMLVALAIYTLLSTLRKQ